MSTVSVWVESNISEIAVQWTKFAASMPIAMSEWADVASPTIIEALRTQAPVGKRIDPRTSGLPHMRTRIRVQRITGGATAILRATTNVGLYPYYVMEGVSGGKLITPKNAGGVLAWVSGGGTWRYAKKVHQGSIKANPFNARAWGLAQGPVTEELALRVLAGLDG